MPDFKVVSDFQPTGDQPKAIEQLVKGLREGFQHQTLLGATGTGKTAVMAWVIEQVQRPALVMAHNKTLAAQLYSELKERSLRAQDRHLHRERLPNQRGD